MVGPGSHPRSVLAVYGGMGFDFKVLYASVWLHKGLPKWAELLEWLQAPGQILLSKPYDEAGRGNYQRVLPFVAMSSVALVSVTSAWSWAGRRRCGLQQDANRERARILSDYLVAVAAAGEWDLWLFAGTHFRARWPRPPEGTSPVCLPVKDGFFDVSELARLCREHPAREAHDFADLFIAAAGMDEGMCHIGDLLGGAWRASASELGRSLLAQVLHSLGARLDQVVSLASGEVSSTGVAIPPCPRVTPSASRNAISAATTSSTGPSTSTPRRPGTLARTPSSSPSLATRAGSACRH